MTPGACAYGGPLPTPMQPAPTGPGYGAGAPPPVYPARYPYGYGGCGDECRGNGCCGDPCQCPTRWAISGEALALHRSGTPSQTLVRAGNQDVLNADDLEPEWGVGPRIDGVFQCCEGWGLEGVYFGIDNWSRSRDVSGTLTSPLLNRRLTFRSVSGSYGSDLRDAEFNVRREWADCLTTFAGFRYTQLSETASLQGTTVNLGHVTSDTQLLNNMYGFQVGGDLALGRCESCVYVDTFLKAGVFGNEVTRDTTRSDSSDGTQTAHQTRGQTSMIGETGLRVVWDVVPWCSIYCGYEAMWLVGVATAPEHLDPTVNLFTGRTLFYHGGIAGLATRW
jgi:hypothetical protein